VNKFYHFIRDWLKGPESGTTKVTDQSKKQKLWIWLIVLLVIGVFLMILSSLVPANELPSQTAAPTKADTSPATVADYEKWYQQSLVSVLRQVVGIGDVAVFVNVDSIDEVVVEKNRQDTQQVMNEQDQKGAVRETTEMKRDGQVALIGSGTDQQPLIVKKVKPRIRGVLVVADGIENLTLKKMVVEAVERTLDVPSHRISVLPRKKQ
jgi:stage III sporulation protein AG